MQSTQSYSTYNLLMGEINKSTIIEIQLSGERLEAPTNNFEALVKSGSELYRKNKDFIKEKIPDNWFVSIEPVSGKLFAWNDELELYQHIKSQFPDRLFYSVGLLKDNRMNYAPSR